MMNGVAKLPNRPDDLSILDIDYIAAKNTLAISSSDHSITLWSIVNITTGAYVFAGKIVNRFPVVVLKWCPPLKRLMASGAEYSQLWDIETQRVDARLAFHQDRITDCIELPLTSYFATCSFDHNIAVWDVTTLQVAFVLEGHTQGVRTLDYHPAGPLGGLLLSSGFEHLAYCWNLATRSLLTTLGGHQHPLIGARFVSSNRSTTVLSVVTGDASGHFRLWDLAPCLKIVNTSVTSSSSNSYGNELAYTVQHFDVHRPALNRFSVFACGLRPQKSFEARSSSAENDHVDIITGNLRLDRFRAVMPSDDSSPAKHVVFNAVTNTLLGSVDGCITVWNANSGAKMETPIFVRDSEVCGIAFDVPRERKLFIATSVSLELHLDPFPVCS